MVYTRSSNRNTIDIIEKLESDKVQLKKENSVLDKKNAELQEEITRLKKKTNRLIKKKNELVNKYNNPTDTREAVDRILDLLLKFPNAYHERSDYFHEKLYATLAEHLCCGTPDTYETLINNKHNLGKNVIVDSEIYEKYIELMNKFDE